LLSGLTSITIQERHDLAEAAKPENKPDMDAFRKEGFDF
jgi:hypothetical protein